MDNAHYFEQLVRSVLDAMQTRQDGIFQIDLQLRPHGKAGSMAVPFEFFPHLLRTRWTGMGL